MNENKHIHFIGICGVAMGSLAMAFARAGYRVTGSDTGFFPPMSTALQDAKIEFYPGFHPEKMGKPDLVVVGNVASSTNPEWRYTQEKKITFISYPEAIAQFFLHRDSVVCAGTYGKTSTSALLSFAAEQIGLKPSYMFGGLALKDFPSAQIDKGEWSILEGDEYKSARWDLRPKFAHYKPTHLLLTAVAWDHADIYPTEESYFEAFRSLLKSLSADGVLVYSENAREFIRHKYNGQMPTRAVCYGAATDCDYQHLNVENTPTGLRFDLRLPDKKIISFSSPCLGEYMAENITGAYALAQLAGWNEEKTFNALTSFPGLKRRLEKRYQGEVVVFDDIAHSPDKARSCLTAIRSAHPRGRIFSIFEPNTGYRQPASLPQYAGAFNLAHEVIIPRLTKLKTAPDTIPPLSGPDIAKNITANGHTNVKYIDRDEDLLKYLMEQTKKDDIIAFLGSHGFRGMIEELTISLQTSIY